LYQKELRQKYLMRILRILGFLAFQSNSTNDLKSALYTLKKSTDKELAAIILDLRNNPGGVLGSAVGITDLFLKEGKIVYTKGRTLNSKLEYKGYSSRYFKWFAINSNDK
jgi:carboxyl-terminal processing protease